MSSLTPKEIVTELDRYIIGQKDAKKSVGIALRNRWRRQQVEKPLQDEIYPKNIIMIGPTGVGKTEIARRLAKLAQAPFIKVEATKYTEVGYVGKDVESMIRDLTGIAINMVKDEARKRVQKKATDLAEERILDLLLPRSNKTHTKPPIFPNSPEPSSPQTDPPQTQENSSTRENLRTMLKEGKLNNRYVELDVNDNMNPTIEIFSPQGMEEMDFNFKDAFSSFLPKRKKRRRLKVPDALKVLSSDEAKRLVDMEKVKKEAIFRVEQNGIVFLDEIDKIAGRQEAAKGPDVSREGVQRDILPVVEGCTVSTKHGVVKTDHILFIASGAFNLSKPSDLIPELQGRFPIRVELNALTSEDFYRILTEPENSLSLQYKAMMRSEGITIIFEDDALKEISKLAANVNDQLENIGARRLNTVMEYLFEEISFNAPDLSGQEITITDTYVRERLDTLVNDQDLSRFIL